MKTTLRNMGITCAALVLTCLAVAAARNDAVDPDQGRADRAKKLLTGITFSHPTEITNPYLPLGSLKQDILEGKEEGKKVRVERTAMPGIHKTFTIGDQTVESLAVEDRAFEEGALKEVTIDYFAQDDKGTVYYLGEEVNEYENGKVKGHEGSWMLGKETQVPGVLLPAQPKAGDKFKSEDVSKEISEEDEVISFAETVTAPAGTYKNCLKIKEKLADGTTEYKYYALGIGVVREVPHDGDILLTSHTTKTANPQNSGSNVKSPAPSAQATAAQSSNAAKDPLAREALAYVGMDPDAEAYWAAAINNPNLSAHERQDLIEDLNEDGLADPKHPTLDELPLIVRRMLIIEEMSPFAMDQVNADAFQEAYKDLLNLGALATGRGEPVK